MERDLLNIIYKAFKDGTIDANVLLVTIIVALAAMSYYYIRPIWLAVIKGSSNDEIVGKLGNLEEKLDELSSGIENHNIKFEDMPREIHDMSKEISYIKGNLSGFRKTGL